jgi:hypothetical protein
MPPNAMCRPRAQSLGPARARVIPSPRARHPQPARAVIPSPRTQSSSHRAPLASQVGLQDLHRHHHHRLQHLPTPPSQLMALAWDVSSVCTISLVSALCVYDISSVSSLCVRSGPCRRPGSGPGTVFVLHWCPRALCAQCVTLVLSMYRPLCLPRHMRSC